MKKQKRKRSSLVLRICIFAFVVYAAVQLVDMQIALSERRQQLSDLEVEYEQQRMANKELERQLAQGVDEEYIERLARDKMEFVAPDEHVYIDVSGN